MYVSASKGAIWVEKLLKKHWQAALLLAAVIGVTSMLMARLLIRHLYIFLSAEPQFSAIFAQLRTASMGTPLWLLAPAYAVSYPAVKLRRVCAPASVILCVVLWLALLLGALYFTAVNGVLFGDVVVSLLDVLQKGGFDGL